MIFSSIQISNAQLHFKLGVVKSDMSYKNLTSKEIFNSKINPLIFGLFYEWTPTNIAGFEAGVQYHGLIEKSSINTIPDFKNHYLSLPFSLNYKPNSIISPGIGIQFSGLIDGSISEEVKSKKYDISGFAKINIQPLDKIGAEIGYNFGFVPFTNLSFVDLDGIELANGSFKNRYIYLLLRYKI
ncbi:MAG: hypothetical protein RLZZ546_1019 [Bacteroidota bacterium]|jgi:hypothetical protein